MIKIIKLNIERFRSILNVEFKIDDSLNLIALCGQNNVGKTNTLRAINLFFNPEDYDERIDKPTIKHATGGGSIHPKISIEFFDSESLIHYFIIRDLKDYNGIETGLQGFKYSKNKTKIDKKTRKDLSEKDLKDFFNKIGFAYIESININIPELIDKLSNDMIDIEYDKQRFTNTKKELKQAYDKYTNGLQDILDVFAKDISQTFHNFKNDWNIKIEVPKNSDRFRDLISDDVELLIDDKGSVGIVEKGSGLQRLTAILLNFEILNRIKSKKHLIVCVDEPDIYLHEGLQKKLKNFFDINSNRMQIFYTTHSKIFINEYNMKNVFLIAAKNKEKFSTRKNKNINITETYLVNIEDDKGYNIICDHLGIEKNNYNVIENKNIIVEGSCDKKYLSELCKFFNIEAVNIISINGVNNAEKYLDYYNSYYNNLKNEIKPQIKVILDNDVAGREVIKKINSKKYQHIIVKCELLQNCWLDANTNLEKNNTNNEIEDFLYPELICFLINVLLEKRKLNKISIENVCKKISSKSFKQGGILQICEHEKNSENLDLDDNFSFVSSGKSTSAIKESLANIFNIQANKPLLELLINCDKKYQKVREKIQEIMLFE